jgi:DNA-binding NarL/FixJ family response regulator
MRPSILIADDHRLFAEGISSLLSSSYEVVGVATMAANLQNWPDAISPI